MGSSQRLCRNQEAAASPARGRLKRKPPSCIPGSPSSSPPGMRPPPVEVQSRWQLQRLVLQNKKDAASCSLLRTCSWASALSSTEHGPDSAWGWALGASGWDHGSRAKSSHLLCLGCPHQPGPSWLHGAAGQAGKEHPTANQALSRGAQWGLPPQGPAPAPVICPASPICPLRELCSLLLIPGPFTVEESLRGRRASWAAVLSFHFKLINSYFQWTD